MPIPYVSQFVPTNMQALQGVLGEYQQAHDQNLARELGTMDQYSVIPTISPGDTSEKSKRLTEFSDKLKELEKKHNFDRASSAYTKELAREISTIRQDPFWTYNERKKEVADLSQKMKAQLGANYFAPNDPLSATFEDQSAIDNYQPMNLQDLRHMMSSLANEYATSNFKDIGRIQNVLNPVTGIVDSFVELGTQYGFETADQAAEWLGGKDGQEWLMNSIKSTPFGQYADDATIASVARGAAMEKLVGQKDSSMQRLSQPSTDSGKTGGLGGLTKVSNTPQISQYGSGNLRTYRQQEVAGELSEEDQIFVDAVYNDVKNTPRGQNVLKSGKAMLATTSVGKNLSYDQLDQVYNIVMRGFETSNAFERSSIAGTTAGALQDLRADRKKIKEEFGEKYPTQKGLPGLLRHIPTSQELYNAAQVINPYKMLGKSEADFKSDIKNDLNSELGLNLSDKETREIVKKLKTHYNSQYAPQIENVVNNNLKSGVALVGDVYSLPVTTTGAERAQLKNNLFDISEFMMPVGDPSYKGTKDSQMWKAKKFNEFMANTDPENLSMYVIRDNNSMPTIVLKDRGNTKAESLQFTINPDRQGLAAYERLGQFFGDQGFVEDIYRGMLPTPVNRRIQFKDNDSSIVPLLKIFGDMRDPNNMERATRIFEAFDTAPEVVFGVLEKTSWIAEKGPNGAINYKVDFDGAKGTLDSKNELIRALQNYILAELNTLRNN